MLTVAAIQEIADKYNKSVAQIALRWSLQHGFLPLPKSTHKERIIENGQLFDFELTADDMAALDKLEGVAGSHNDADKTNF
jgi:diketogulonate reductase-like aldo/keto reductase